MQRPQATKWTAGGVILLLTMLSVAAAIGGQGTGLVGYLPKDRVVALAAAADASIASHTPSPAALASFAALVDPVHLRVFLCASIIMPRTSRKRLRPPSSIRRRSQGGRC